MAPLSASGLPRPSLAPCSRPPSYDVPSHSPQDIGTCGPYPVLSWASWFLPEGWGYVCISEGECVARDQNRTTQLDPSRACSCPAALTGSGCDFQFLQLGLTDAAVRSRKALLSFCHDVQCRGCSEYTQEGIRESRERGILRGCWRGWYVLPASPPTSF